MTPDETVERNAAFEELDREIKTEALFDLSEEQIAAYGQRACREAQAHRSKP